MNQIGACEFAAECSNPAGYEENEEDNQGSGDATLAIHVGQDKFHKGTSVGVEIARTANFTFASTEEMKRWAEGRAQLTSTRATETHPNDC